MTFAIQANSRTVASLSIARRYTRARIVGFVRGRRVAHSAVVAAGKALALTVGLWSLLPSFM